MTDASQHGGVGGDSLPGAGRSVPGLRAEAKARPRWLIHVAIAAILLVAAALRLERLGAAELKIDEAQPPALAEQILFEHKLPFAYGVSSTGLPETPFIGYLLVLPRAVSADPRASVAFLGLLDIVAVLLTYVAVRRLADTRLALVAAALYAANPWAVVFSRKTWSEIVPLFTVVMLWAAYEVVVGRKPAWALAFFPLAALQVQCHVMGALFLPAMLLTVLLYPRRWTSRYTFVGLVLGVLILLPYGLALAGQWGATKAILRQNGGQGLIFDLKAVTYALWFASGATLTALMGQSVAALRPWEQALRLVNLATAALLAGALALCGWAALRRRSRDERAVLLLIWLVGPVAPLVFMRGALGVHYLLLLVPALFVLLAIGWAALVGARARGLAFAGGVALGAMLLIQAGAVVAVYDGVLRYPTEGGFGRPLAFWQRVQQGVRTRVAAEGARQIEVLGIDDAPWSSERNVLDYLLQRSVRLHYVGLGGRPGLVVPDQGEVLALAVSADPAMAQALAHFGEEVERWPVPGNEWGVRLYRLRGRSEAAIDRELTLVGPVTFDNGMCLVGACLPDALAPGGRVTITTYWRFSGRFTRPGVTDTVFTHLVDATGKRWAQNDGFALSRSQWQPGETLVQWFALDLPADLPAGDYWLFTGMYSWQDMSRASVLDPNGQPVSDGARLGPLHIRALNAGLAKARAVPSSFRDIS